MDINKGLIILFFAAVNLVQGNYERDLLLTPKLALHVNGRTVYYKPPVKYEITNETTDQVPWEQTLKHVTFLTLNSGKGNFSNSNNFNDYKRFMNSTYVKTNEYIPRFGDIITLARGRLENLGNNNFRFVEGVCVSISDCNFDIRSIVAFWQVQKIRHRDIDRKFRYELRFSVNPFNADKSESGKREIKHYPFKSFIQKDIDYPTSFSGLDEHIAYRRSDDSRGFLNIVTNVKDIYKQPKQLKAPERNAQFYNNLNIGEYIRHPKLISMPTNTNSRTGQFENNVIFPTTYRPSYNFNFPKPNIFERYPIPLEQQTTTSRTIAKETPVTHLHHHFYIPKDDNTKNEKHSDEVKFKDSYEALTFLEPSNKEFFTPAPISNQIPIPPSYRTETGIVKQQPQSIFYMHPIPISAQLPIFLYPQVSEPQPRTPFRESELDEQKHHYSEPDPLYQNINAHTSGSEEDEEDHDKPGYTTSTHYEIPRDIKRQQKMDTNEENNENEQTTKYDSINAQLPPPHEGQDLRVPYVEVSAATETTSTLKNDEQIIMPQPHVTEAIPELMPTFSTSATTQNEIPQPSKRIELTNETQNIKHVSTTMSTTTEMDPSKASKVSTHKIRTYSRSTTERPILKWKPKKKLKDLIEKAATKTSEKHSTNILPFIDMNDESNSSTQKIMIVTPSTNVISIPTKQSVKKSVSIKIGNKGKEIPLEKKVGEIKTFELYPADLVNIKTNSSDIHVFKASEKQRTKDGGDLEDLELTKSIVEHIKSLS